MTDLRCHSPVSLPGTLKLWLYSSICGLLVQLIFHAYITLFRIHTIYVTKENSDTKLNEPLCSSVHPPPHPPYLDSVGLHTLSPDRPSLLLLLLLQPWKGFCYKLPPSTDRPFVWWGQAVFRRATRDQRWDERCFCLCHSYMDSLIASPSSVEPFEN